MKFIAIVQTYKDVPDEFPQALPPGYPIDCREVEAESLEQAQAKYPDKKVLSVENYGAYHDGCMHALELANSTSVKIAQLNSQVKDLSGHVDRLKARGMWSRLRNKDV